MAKVRCKTCVGSGRVMGGGMMQQDCEVCDGVGKIYIDEQKEFKIDKDSKHYKDAIKKIKALNKDMSNKEAAIIFEKELNNLKDEKNGNPSQTNILQADRSNHCDILPA